ncbi:MAG: FtsX-like permease family protein [Bacillaceae bacterium]
MIKKKALHKDIMRTISKSKGRFISIFALMAIGIFAFVGLKVTGPNMRETAESFYNKHHLADATIVSSYGLDEDDQRVIEQVDSIDQIEYGYMEDTIIKDEMTTMRIFSRPTQLSTYQVVSGRLPKKANEIALSTALDSHYTIGDKITVVNNEGSDTLANLKQNTFKIVGFVNASEFISITDFGQSQISTGKLDAFAVVPKESFDMDVYAIARITYKDTASLKSHSNRYKTLMTEHVREMEKALVNRPTEKLATLKKEATDTIREKEKALNDGKKKLADTEKKLQDANDKLIAGKKDYANGKDQLEAQLTAAKEQLLNGQKQLETANQQLIAASTQLTEGKKALQDAKIQYKEKESQFQQAKAQLQEAKKLLATNEVTLKEKEAVLQQSQTELQEKEGQLVQSEQQLNVAFVQLNEQQAELDALREQIGDTAEIQAKQQQLDNKRKELEELQTTLNRSKQELQNAQTTLTEQAQLLEVAKSELSMKQGQLADNEALLNQNEKTLQVAAKTIQSNEIDLKNGENKLNQQQQLYETKKEELKEGQQSYEQAKKEGEAKLEEAYQQLEASEKMYKENLQKFQQEKPKVEKELRDGEQQLADAKKQVESLALPRYVVNERENNPGYAQYSDYSVRMDVLSNVFPVFFLAIAVLVCLTTITRMVEEERSQMGTLKALGYSNAAIVSKYIIYGGIASLFGAIVGIVTGHTILPTVIFDAYAADFIFGKIAINYHLGYCLLSIGIALVCSTVSAILVARNELKGHAAELMRIKPPKNGKRILLERIPFIWKHLSFDYKVTARNLFRYKKRMFMTIFGVAGCTGLLVTGFGLSDSLNGLVNRQFTNIIHYDLLSVFDPDSQPEDLATYEQALASNEKIDQYGQVLYEQVTAKEEGIAKQDITLIAPNKKEELATFISLQNRQSNQSLQLSDDGAIITEKLAKLLDVQKGSTFAIKDEDGKEHTIKVAAITEMYIGHYIYMSPTYYETIFQQAPTYNANLITLHDNTKKEVEQTAATLMKEKASMTVIQSKAARQIVSGLMDGLSNVIVVLIACASLLAIVVLYNLTNINISERIRELSTIKVLGFYPQEVTMYVYRETFLLTFIGILGGYVFGYFMHGVISETMPPDESMFNPDILWSNLVISACMTMFFSVVVMIVMHIKLKAVDMIEALKSVE